MYWRCRGACELCDSGMAEKGAAGYIYMLKFELIGLVSSGLLGL